MRLTIHLDVNRRRAAGRSKLQASVEKAGHATSKVLESQSVISVRVVTVSQHHSLSSVLLIIIVRYQVVLASPASSRYLYFMTTLEAAARNFVVSPKAARLLERHRANVLMLRAKEAALSQIQDFLAQHGVVISESSITRFCRKHRAEIQRLRLQLEQEIDVPSGSPCIPTTAPSAPPLTQGRKLRDLRGDF